MCQLLKDSTGKLPFTSIKAVSNRLAAWGVLKSPREKAREKSGGLAVALILPIKRRLWAIRVLHGNMRRLCDNKILLKRLRLRSQRFQAYLPTRNKKMMKRKVEEKVPNHLETQSKGINEASLVQDYRIFISVSGNCTPLPALAGF